MDGVTTGGVGGGFDVPVPVVTGSIAKTAREVTDEKRAKWSYEEAFKRNRGLISEEEQQKLRNSRVAIAGMGGVGGVHLITLARLGIGKFTIADPDVFEVANFNRQYGATISNFGRHKVEAMADLAWDINPELEITTIKSGVSNENVDLFLRQADIVVDGLDLFAMDVRRLLFQRASEKGIYALTAAPLGFGTAWLIFDPDKTSFDQYFDFNDQQSQLDQLIAFAIGLAPKSAHQKYMDLRHFDFENECGPSTTVSCQLSAAIVGEECIRILLGRPDILCVPHYRRFDPYKGGYVCSRLPFGNRHPLQRFKRWCLKRVAHTLLNGKKEAN